MPLNEWERLDSLECHTPQSVERGKERAQDVNAQDQGR